MFRRWFRRVRDIRFRVRLGRTVSAAARHFGRQRRTATGGRRWPRVQIVQPDDDHDHRVRVDEVDDEEPDWRPDARLRCRVRGSVGEVAAAAAAAVENL